MFALLAAILACYVGWTAWVANDDTTMFIAGALVLLAIQSFIESINVKRSLKEGDEQ